MPTSSNGARNIITFQKYERPQTLDEAWELNQKKRNRIVAGTMWMKMGTHSFGTAIDLCDLGLNQIEETDEEFRIGAMVTLRRPRRLFLRRGGSRLQRHRGRAVPQRRDARRKPVAPHGLFRHPHGFPCHG